MRPYGSGQLYVKSGGYYARWRALDGRRLNRRLGKVRKRGSSEGITRTDADRAMRRLIEAESRQPAPLVPERDHTVDDAVVALRDRLAVEGARLSYRQNCESMQRVHISPVIGGRHVGSITQQDVERLTRLMLRRGLAPKTVRNVMNFLHAGFALALDNGWIATNPVTRAARPRRRRQGDANPDLKFLTLHELDAVIAAIPDETLRPEPRPRPVLGRLLPGTARRTFTPAVNGFLTVRSAGSGDWDLVAYDGPSGRRLAASQGFGASEVVQAWVGAGRKVVLTGERLKLTFELAQADLPKTESASLVRVTVPSAERFEALEALGVDVTHNIRAGYADVVLRPGDAVRLTQAGFTFATRRKDLDATYLAARRADARAPGSASPLPSGRTTYRDYADYQAELKALAEKNPGLVRAMKLPKSV